MIARSQPCTILMTADTVGGVWTYAMELCGALAPANVQIVLATMGQPLSDAQWKAARSLANVVVEESSYRLEWMDGPWLDVDRAGRWLRDLSRRYRPDVIHLNGYAHAAIPFDAPVLVVAHSDVLTWWKAVHGEPAPSSWSRYREVVTTGLRAADLVVAPTSSMLHSLEEEYGPLPHTRAIPNGRQVTTCAPSAKEPMVMASGRLWDKAKNVAALCTASDGLQWPVYVAGSDREPDGRRVAMAGVRTLGELDPPSLYAWLGRAAIFAHPARYEPFGLAVLEAASCGCALVLGDIPSLRELWDDFALYVAPDDDRALHASLEMLIDRPTLRRELAAGAQRRARRFTAEAMAAQYLLAYHSLGVNVVLDGEVVECAS